MKAVQKGYKTMLRKNDNYKEMERKIQLLSEEFERLKNTCEGRATKTFLKEVIKRIVEKWYKLREMGRDIEIPEDYVRLWLMKRMFMGASRKQYREQRSVQ